MAKDKTGVCNLKKALQESILSVPGIANIYQSDTTEAIEVIKSDLSWIININIICFFDNNIWNIMNQAQKSLRYIAEKHSKYQDYIVLNIIVHDLIEE